MKNVSRFAIALVLLAATTMAQFEVNGPNAVYTINGTVPSNANAATHDVSVSVPGVFDQTIVTNANQQSGVILALSPVDPTGAAIANIPGLGIWNLGTPGVPLPGNVVLVGDGIGFSVNINTDVFYRSDNGIPAVGAPPTFRLAFNVGTVLCGTRVAWQAVVQEPVSMFGLDLTECGDANFLSGQDLILLTGDDGSVQVPFGVGNSFNFYGVNYTEIYVCGNGFASFGGFTTVNAAGFTQDAQSWVNAEPSIAPCMTDWTVSGNGFNDGVLFREVGSQLFLTWGDPAALPSGATGIPHFADNDSNRFGIILELASDGSNPCVPVNPNEGTVSLNYAFLDPNATNRAGDGVMGITPGGGALVGGAFDRDLHGTNVGNAGEAMVENHNATTFAASTLNNSIGQPRAYNEFRSWDQNQTCTLTPLGSPAGSSGYITIGGCTAIDDVTGFPVNSIQSAGGMTLTIAGKFCGFGATGSVVFDPTGSAGVGPISASVIGVLDGAYGLPLALPNISDMSAYRDAEGLVIITPALGAYTGPMDVDFVFDSGYIETIPTNITAPGITFTSYTLPDDGFLTHNLSVPGGINFYGVNYLSLILNSNGYVTFNSGSGDFTPTLAELFNGLGGFAGNPAVAVMYADLNSGGTASGATYDVTENTVTGDVTVSYTNQNWWNSIAPAGTNTVTFQLATNTLVFDHSGFIAAPPGIDDVIAGFSNGDGNAANDVTGLALGYVSVVPGESIGQFDFSGTTPNYVTFNGTGVWNALDAGANGSWIIF